MKVISWNVNGLRSIAKKDFVKNIKKINPDIFCLQEIKANVSQLPPGLVNFPGYTSFFNSSQRPGLSGVAVYSRKAVLSNSPEIGLEQFDKEGRFLRLDFPNFTLINLYIPHGGREKENLGYKLEVYDFLLSYLSHLSNSRVILTGDFNIAHTELDLARPVQNKNNIMFTPEERLQIDKLIGLGFADTFRKFNDKGENYSWWPYFAEARQRNLGWRLDYVFTSPSLSQELKNAFILPQFPGSDHCPVGVEI